MPAKRLRLPAEIQKDQRDFAKRSSQFFIVRSRANQLSHPRFAVVVSVKVEGTAVGRHRLKRRLRERLRRLSGNWDMIVTVLPAAKSLSPKEFLKQLENILP